MKIMQYVNIDLSKGSWCIKNVKGTKEWFLDGNRHREDGPAVECANGTKEWYLKGKRHREDGPAVKNCSNGTKFWYVGGKLHRTDGPAVERVGGVGFKHWYVDGKRHRLDGPAVELSGGSKEWFVEGKLLTEEKFNKHIIGEKKQIKHNHCMCDILQVMNVGHDSNCVEGK